MIWQLSDPHPQEKMEEEVKWLKNECGFSENYIASLWTQN
jgi:hypothetical protein